MLIKVKTEDYAPRKSGHVYRSFIRKGTLAVFGSIAILGLALSSEAQAYQWCNGYSGQYITDACGSCDLEFVNGTCQPNPNYLPPSTGQQPGSTGGTQGPIPGVTALYCNALQVNVIAAGSNLFHSATWGYYTQYVYSHSFSCALSNGTTCQATVLDTIDVSLTSDMDLSDSATSQGCSGYVNLHVNPVQPYSTSFYFVNAQGNPI